MSEKRLLALACALAVTFLLVEGPLAPTGAQPKPEGEMRWALYVTLAPLW